jgi:hypothetical protein
MTNKALIYTIIVVVVVLIFGGIFAAGIIFWTRESPIESYCGCKKQPKIENFVMEKSNFYVHNYLLKPIIISSTPESERKFGLKHFELVVGPQNKKSVSESDVIQFFRNGHTLRISVLGLPDSPRWYSDYTMDLPTNKTIKALHVGMITSKMVGNNGITKTGWTAVQGRPFVTIHNQTGIDLGINHNINIPAYTYLNYSGRDNFGVRLGTILTDSEGIFPSFKMKQPATDIYWGVVSDLQQPFFGGWQLTHDLDHSMQEPHYLLENGWMGGPSSSKITPGFLPKEGPEVPLLDRWGRPFEEKETKTPEEYLNYIFENQPQIVRKMSGVSPYYQPDYERYNIEPPNFSPEYSFRSE